MTLTESNPNASWAAIDAPKMESGYVRVLANAPLDPDWIGKTWKALSESITYNLNVGGNSSYPLYADIGETSLRDAITIGSEENPKILKRSTAKVTVKAEEGITFEGFRVFQMHGQSYLFPQEEITNVPGTKTFNETGYEKEKVSTFIPETKLVDTDEEWQTFVVIKATYEGVAGYYRIDFRKDKELFNIERNKHYLIQLNADMGYGYPTEAEAIADPYNDAAKHVNIETYDAYDFVYNENKNYLGFSNSTVVIYGKAEYYATGFRGDKTAYPYVLTQIEIDGGDDEVVLLDKDDLTIEKKVIDEGGKKYLLLTAPMTGATPDKAYNVTLGYKNMLKTLKVIWKNEYIDCTYSRLDLDSYMKENSIAEVKAHIRADGTTDGESAPLPGWIGLITRDVNASSTGNLFQRLSGIGSKYVQFRENVDGAKMGRLATGNAPLEGFRFADVYAGNALGTTKFIFAQANADLSGYFGGTKLAPYAAVSNDDGTQYDGYLVSERITDERYASTDLSTYCKDKNPSDNPNLWYLPSSRQLMSLWLTNHSDSRKTSPMITAATGANYVARNNYTADQISLYEESKRYYPGANNDTRPLNHPDRYWTLNFSDGETGRGPAGGDIRCVRNLPEDKLPDEIKSKPAKPVSGNTVTLDPKGYLDDDYFPTDVWNPVRRKIELLDPHGYKQYVYVYKWTGDAEGYYVGRTETYIDYSFILDRHYYQHVYEWENYSGWRINGLTRYRKDYGEGYETSWERYYPIPIWDPDPPTAPDINEPNEREAKPIEAEYTLTESYINSINSGGRLPSLRELQLIYIYHDELVKAGMEVFYKDEEDGYGDGNPDGAPYNVIWTKYRYPAADNVAYQHWYWSSTTQDRTFTGTDGSMIPLRISFHFGDVNARLAGQTDQIDHYRAVRTVQ